MHLQCHNLFLKWTSTPHPPVFFMHLPPWTPMNFHEWKFPRILIPLIYFSQTEFPQKNLSVLAGESVSRKRQFSHQNVQFPFREKVQITRQGPKKSFLFPAENYWQDKSQFFSLQGSCRRKKIKNFTPPNSRRAVSRQILLKWVMGRKFHAAANTMYVRWQQWMIGVSFCRV